VEAFRSMLQSDSDAVVLANPEEADVILFVQAHMVSQRDVTLRTIVDHPLRKRFADRCLVYDERDRPWSALPGLYVSMPRPAHNRNREAPVPYYGAVPEGLLGVRESKPDLLFSFMGSRTHPCRNPLYGLKHPRGLVRDTTGFVFWDVSARNFADHRLAFVEAIGRSKFVLCPRGHGTSSIRSYEVLAAGRVPVIISDEWVQPARIDWESCSIRWPERDVEGLLEFLEECEDDYDELSRAAAQEFDGHCTQVAKARWFRDDLLRIKAQNSNTRFEQRRDFQYYNLKGRAVARRARNVTRRAAKLLRSLPHAARRAS
jgi:hypothetical protein